MLPLLSAVDFYTPTCEVATACKSLFAVIQYIPTPAQG